MKQEPSQLRPDHDGHWYLVPESRLVEFEDVLAFLDEDSEDKAAQDALATFDDHCVEDPSNLRIFSWQEL